MAFGRSRSGQQRGRRWAKTVRYANGRFHLRLQAYAFSAFRLCQLCAPHIEQAGGGAILNISSMAGENTDVRRPQRLLQGRVNDLNRNMAFDLGAKGIRVNAIAPGATRTAAGWCLLRSREEDVGAHPAGPARRNVRTLPTPLFLCSPAAAGSVVRFSRSAAVEFRNSIEGWIVHPLPIITTFWPGNPQEVHRPCELSFVERYGLVSY